MRFQLNYFSNILTTPLPNDIILKLNMKISIFSGKSTILPQQDPKWMAD